MEIAPHSSTTARNGPIIRSSNPAEYLSDFAIQRIEILEDRHRQTIGLQFEEGITYRCRSAIAMTLQSFLFRYRM